MYLFYFIYTFRTITTWSVIIFLWTLQCCRAGSDGMFECGTHGRFEYCIDGIPGCVIGCHCHPGYYFDTETKICEPNTKLTLNYRRYNVAEPTRIQNPSLSSEVVQTEPLPVLTTHNIIDEHVNDITKNADDLGDWLYNQFFKTIENQVINKTNKDSQLTRRSGRGSLPKHSKLKRRARRKGNRHKKKKKGLKGKLLRIAEDDSLFQSSDSSDSESNMHSSQSYPSVESSDSDEDHGHKKIVLINKKPRPPLPSFIFLPNMNTPFFPPLGLPPPPVMPMYPMVPVPPMMPAPPFQGHIPECDENTTTAKTGSATTTQTTQTTNVATTTEELSTKTVSITTTTVQSTPESSKAPSQRSHYKNRKRKKMKSFENVSDYAEEPPFDIFMPNLENREKILKQLRQRINRPRVNDPSYNRHGNSFDNNYMNQLMPPDPLTESGPLNGGVPKSENSPPVHLEDTSELDNVDFKYLSQLIHRVKDNQTHETPVHVYNDAPKTIIPSEWFKNRDQHFNVPTNSGRRATHYIKSSRNNQADDSYYSNLGRQIATLIRTIDADKEKVEIEKVQQKPNDHPYFNDNGPRTFWERSVRSPLKPFHYLKTKFEDLDNSNDMLFKIENKVETVASTVATLSLQDIENMIKVMEAARSQFQRDSKFNNIKSSPKTFNVNLWPQENKQFEKSIKSSTSPNLFKTNRIKTNNFINNTRREVINSKSIKIGQQNLHPFTDRVNAYKLHDELTNIKLPMQPALRNLNKIFLQSLPTAEKKTIPNSFEKRRESSRYLGSFPTILNYKKFKKYFFDESNQYSFQNDDLRLKYIPTRRPTVNKQQIDPLIPSPYFHHEINHIDYVT